MTASNSTPMRHGLPKCWTLLLVLLTACEETSSTRRDDLPTFAGPPMLVGGIASISGPFSAKAPDLERALIFAEDFINGSTRAYDVADAAQIPCRIANNCGVWMGRDDAGNDIRGPIKLIVGDSDEREARAVAAARQLQDKGVVAIIGPTEVHEMLAIFNEVTQTNTLLVTPVVSDNSISALQDRTASEQTSGAPGWVYRVQMPDYMLVQMLGHVATNATKPVRSDTPILMRYEDQTEDECTSQGSPTYCSAGHGSEFQCTKSRRSSVPNKDYFKISDKACTGQPEDFCDSLGLNYECVNGLCSQFRERKYCTRVIQPKTAIVFYPDDDNGRGLRDEVQTFWESRGRVVLATSAFDPSKPKAFSQIMSSTFTAAAAAIPAAIDAGSLTAGYNFADTAVFLLADATSGALLLQEWRLLEEALPEGSQSVFWLGVDSLRNTLLFNQVQLHAVRNLYTVDPYTLALDMSEFFTASFKKRWSTEPTQYMGSFFDAAMLVALANERAAAARTTLLPTGPLGPNNREDVKNEFEAAGSGCARASVTDDCTGVGAGLASRFSDVMSDLRAGQGAQFSGVTGALIISPAGDRATDVGVWKVDIGDTDPSKAGFFYSGLFGPRELGVTLRE